MAEKEAEKEIERIYVIPLRSAKVGRSSLAAPRAVKKVRSYLTKHMKVDPEDVWIDDSLNKKLWERGKYKVPSKIRVRAVKFEDNVVEATIPELGTKKSRREILKEEKEKKTPILRREEAEAGELGETGADEYDISPSADGEVKIKKKKAPKPEKKEAEEKPKKKQVKKEKTEAKTVKTDDKKKDTAKKKPAKSTKTVKKSKTAKKTEKKK
jgi:large subunit ribosomal protein L31e